MQKPQRIKGVTAPPKPRTCADFLNEWMPRVRQIDPMVELDFSFKDDAITVTDMRIPSMLRTGVLYTRAEVQDRLDLVNPNDLAERVERFMAQALKGR